VQLISALLPPELLDMAFRQVQAHFQLELVSDRQREGLDPSSLLDAALVQLENLPR